MGEPVMTAAVERKLATVLFADLVGATGLGEELDVEELRDIVDLFFDAVNEEVTACGGTVGQFVGDAVMALFGVPITHEDDADRALTAALGIVSRIGELRNTVEPAYGVELAVRIGVNTGELVVPVAGDLNLGTIAGDAVNVASRLQDEAGAGSVLVAERTVRASRRFAFEDRGNIELRGRRRPIHSYRLAVERTTEGRISPLLQAPMVGRHDQLAELTGFYADVVSSSAARIVTITGAAGVGKSRLVQEFLVALSEHRHAPQVHQGSCLPFGEELPYRPLAQSLRDHVGIKEADDPQVAFERIAETTSELLPGPEGKRLAAVLAYTLGIGDPLGELEGHSPSQLGREIRSGWKTYFSGLSQQAPSVVFIEDLHWADPALIELVDQLGREVEGPVLFLLTARPLTFDAWPNWGTSEYHGAITLDPLDRADAALLLESLLGTEALPVSFERQVLTRAEGNPFFVEEIVGHLVDHRRIRLTEDGWHIPDDVGAGDIPDTVQAVLAARIDLLDAGDKRALQLAAVIGRTYWTEAVAELLGADSAAVGETLDRLEEREFVRRRASSILTAQHEYEFKHILTREVAYSGLSRRELSRAHGRAFSWIERSGSGNRGEVLDLLAYHATRSYKAGADDPQMAESAREALRTRTFGALLEAAAAARSTIALAKARTLGEQALELATSNADLARANQELGETAFYAYAGDEAWRHYRRAIDLRLDAGDVDPVLIARLCARALETPVRWPGTMLSPPTEAVVHRYLSTGYDHAGATESEELARLLMLESFWQHAYPPRDGGSQMVSPEESLAAGETAAAIAHRLDLPALESAALDGVAANWIPQGRYDLALQATTRRMNLRNRISDPWELGDIHAMGGWLNYHIGHYREALQFGEAGFELTISEIPSVALHCVTWRGLARYKLGDWEGLFSDVEVAQSILGERRNAPPHFASPLYAAAAVARELRGEEDQADAILDILAGLHDKAEPEDRDASPLARWASYVAVLLSHRGRYKDASRLIEETAWRRGARRGLLLQTRCRVALEARAWGEAEAIAEEARFEAATCGLQALSYEADLLAGAAAIAAGAVDDGARLMLEASEGFHSLGAVWDESVARLVLVETLVDIDPHSATVAGLERAAAVFSELGADRERTRALALLSAAA